MPAQAPQLITRSCKTATKLITGRKRESATASVIAHATATTCQKTTRRTFGTLRVCPRHALCANVRPLCKPLESRTKRSRVHKKWGRTLPGVIRLKLADFDDARYRGCQKSSG